MIKLERRKGSKEGIVGVKKESHVEEYKARNTVVKKEVREEEKDSWEEGRKGRKRQEEVRKGGKMKKRRKRLWKRERKTIKGGKKGLCI